MDTPLRTHVPSFTATVRQPHAAPSSAGGAAPAATPNLGPKATELGLIVFSDAAREAPREWLVDGLLLKQSVNFIGGQPKVGKSWLALDLALSVAAGLPFLDRETRQRGPVLYFAGEDFFGDLSRRADRLLLDYEAYRYHVGGLLSISSKPVNLEDPLARQHVREVVEECKPVLIIFDPLERFLGRGDTNSTRDMRGITQFFREDLSRKGNAAVCVVHHTDKQGKDLRGTGDFRAVSDTTLLVTRMEDQSVRVEAEMRACPPPAPFHLELREHADDAIGWVVLDRELSSVKSDEAAWSAPNT